MGMEVDSHATLPDSNSQESPSKDSTDPYEKVRDKYPRLGKQPNATANRLCRFFNWTPEEFEEFAPRLIECRDEARYSMIEIHAGHFQHEIGPRYMVASLSNFQCTCDEQRAAVKALREYEANLDANIANGTNIVAFGPSGSGKDHLLAGMAKQAFRRLHQVEWISGLAMFSEFRRAADFESFINEEDVVHRLANVPVLVISDVVPPLVPGSDRSKGALTDFVAGMLLRIIDERYKHMRPVWTTANVTGGTELADRLGTAIADRLKDGALCIACNWPSYRKPRGGK